MDEKVWLSFRIPYHFGHPQYTCMGLKLQLKQLQWQGILKELYIVLIIIFISFQAALHQIGINIKGCVIISCFDKNFVFFFNN